MHIAEGVSPDHIIHRIRQLIEGPPGVVEESSPQSAFQDSLSETEKPSLTLHAEEAHVSLANSFMESVRDRLAGQMQVDTLNLAYGKQLQLGGSTDWITFGTPQSLEGVDIATVFGHDLRDVPHGSTFYSRVNVDFFNQRSSTPAVMVSNRGHSLFLAAAQCLHEGILNGDQHSRMSRPFTNSKAAFFDENQFAQEHQNYPLHIALGNHEKWKALDASSKISHRQELKLSAEIIQHQKLESQVFFDREINLLLSKVFYFVLCRQPIILEAEWSLFEKSCFIQMIQDMLAAANSNAVASWISDPICSSGANIDVVFRKPGESTVHPINPSWRKYLILSADDSSSPNHAESRSDLLKQFHVLATNLSFQLDQMDSWEDIWQRVRFESVADLPQRFSSLRSQSIEDYGSDLSRRLQLVKSKFYIFGEYQGVSERVADWMCPVQQREIRDQVSLPKEYFQACRSGKDSGISILKEADLRAAQFVFAFVYHESGQLIAFDFALYGVFQKILTYLGNNFIEVSDEDVSVNTDGLIETINLANQIEELVRLINDLSFYEYFKEVFGSPDPIDGFRQLISQIDQNNFFDRYPNYFFKESRFLGRFMKCDITSEGQELLEKNFSKKAESSLDYMRQWTSFLLDFKNLVVNSKKSRSKK